MGYESSLNIYIFKREITMSRSVKDCKMSKGGSIYERQMVGMHPSSKPPHNNYESDMRGEHPKGGHAEGGPVHRIRLGMATSSGKQKVPAMKKNIMRGMM